MSSQTIYNELKEGDNKKLWAYAQEISEFRRKQERIVDASGVDFSDKDEVKKFIANALVKQMNSGNAASAKELARIYGISEETQDIIINLVNFAEVEWE